MFEVKNFDNWIEDKVSGKFGSGASEKIWLVNPETNELVTGPIEVQAEQAIKNLAALVKEAGSSVDNVIKTTVFIKDINNFSKVNEIYGQYFKECPARSLVEVSKLPKNALIEIEAIAEIK